MDISTLVLEHGNKVFKVDAEDELGVFMYVGEHKIHVRHDDVNLAEGLSISEFHPLIEYLKKL